MSEPTKTEVIKAFALMCNSGLVKPRVEWNTNGHSTTRKLQLLSFAGNYEVAKCEESGWSVCIPPCGSVAILSVASVGECSLEFEDYMDVIREFDRLAIAIENERHEAAEKTARGILSRAREIHNKAVDAKHDLSHGTV